MTAWTPELEKQIRIVGDYVEAQMKDLLNPKASAGGSLTRIFLRAATRGVPAMQKATASAGWEFRHNWTPDLQKLADLADLNGSDAANKIKKALPHVDVLMRVFKSNRAEKTLDKIRHAKNLNIKY